MPSAKSVLPECYIDSNLFDVLLNFEKESVNHTKGNGTVVTKMENKFADLFCVGIIDKDKRDLPQIVVNYDRIEVGETEEYFKLYKRKEKHHYLIQMVPVIEVWICNVAEKLEIKITDFDIKAFTPKELMVITKKIDKKTDPKFKALFKEIIRKSSEKDFLPVLKLKKIVELILEKNYKVDINELING